MGAHPLGGLEGCRRVPVLGLQQREHRERRRGIARDRRGRPDLRDLEEAIDGRDGRRRGGDGLGTLPQTSQRLGLGHLRAPQHVVVLECLGPAAGAAGGVECVRMRAAARERPGQPDLGARGLLRSLETGERLDGLLVRGNPVLELLLRRLGKGQPRDSAGRALLVATCGATVDTLSILIFGQREAARHQIDECQTLPRAPGM